jgi:hypothetical protein
MEERERLIMKKVIAIIVVSCIVFGAANSAMADLTLTDVDGDWSNPVGGLNIIWNDGVGVAYGNGLQDQIRWGVDIGNGQSGLGFTGVEDDGDFTPTNIILDTPFEIGELVHFNNSVQLGSSVSAADLEITMSFAGLDDISFIFTLGVDETDNFPGPPLSDDIISFPNSIASQTFEIEGQEYALMLLGFGNTPDDLVSEFVSPEGTNNATLLWGKIVPVPVPGAVLLGLLGLSAAGLKLRRFA